MIIMKIKRKKKIMMIILIKNKLIAKTKLQITIPIITTPPIIIIIIIKLIYIHLAGEISLLQLIF